MCGIFGAININGFFTKNDYYKFISLTDLVYYRGPNASGNIAMKIKNNQNSKTEYFDVYLGHRRLSIIDLSFDANQPMKDDDTIIVYNGEIFNYLELREELKQLGFKFKTDSDTEVILKIYKQYGEIGFTKLNGMWAFALLDINNKKIILSRDRFSIKPLYYTFDNGKLYFASEIKQLLLLVKKIEINQNIIFTYLAQGLIDWNEETFIKNIYKLKPKHNLIIHIESGKFEYNKYWDYSTEEDVSNLPFRDALERFKELFVDSIKIRLRSDVKVGCLLSGGLDSSSIAVIGNSIAQEKGFCTYSVISEDERYSEEKFIDILSKQKKIDNYKLIFKFANEKDFLTYTNKVLYHNDEPFTSFSVIAQYMIFEKVKQNSDITVLLSGQGGDETLMGYLKYYFFYVYKLFKSYNFRRALMEIIMSFIKKTIIWQFRLSHAKRYIPFLSKSSKYFLHFYDKLEPIWKANDLRERQILDIDKYSIPALTHYEDRNSMAHSLEVRLPFLDHRLVNFILNLPVTYKLRNGYTKYILRKSIDDLPAEIRWRKDKKGFGVPEEELLKKDFSDLIMKIFSKSVLDEFKIINRNLYLEYYRDFQQNKKNISYTEILRVMIAELWLRKLFNFNLDFLDNILIGHDK